MLLTHTRCTPQQVSDELQQVVEDEDEAARRGAWRDAVQYAWRECVVAEAADSFSLGTPPLYLLYWYESTNAATAWRVLAMTTLHRIGHAILTSPHCTN